MIWCQILHPATQCYAHIGHSIFLACARTQLGDKCCTLGKLDIDIASSKNLVEHVYVVKPTAEGLMEVFTEDLRCWDEVCGRRCCSHCPKLPGEIS